MARALSAGRGGLGLLAAAAMLACAAPDPVTPARAEPVQEASGESAPATAELLLRERRGGVMGTDFLIEALGTDPELLDRALDAAEAELRRIDDLMTTWRPSPLMALNARSGEGPVAVDPELARLVDQALRVSAATGEAFDPTWHSAGRLWDFKAEDPVLPDSAAIERALARVGVEHVRVDVEASTVALDEGSSIGLGGIAKGYAVDRALERMRALGVEHGLVDAGGDLRVIGRKRGETWQIAIRHPRRRGEVLAVVPLANVAIVTSGDYERFFELDGTRYHHIIDPRTGRPATGAMSATVVGPEAGLCDALATALCVLGPEEGLDLIEKLERVEALVVGIDGNVHLSTGLPRADAAR